MPISLGRIKSLVSSADFIEMGGSKYEIVSQCDDSVNIKVIKVGGVIEIETISYMEFAGEIDEDQVGVKTRINMPNGNYVEFLRFVGIPI